jgi:hypothetical protein
MEFLVASRTVAQALASRSEHVFLIDRPQAFVLIPLTEALWHELASRAALPPEVGGSDADLGIAPQLAAAVASLSRHGSIAHVAVSSLGPDVTAWREGRLVASLDESAPAPRDDLRCAALEALQAIGVQRSGALDEFAALGLDDFRWPYDFLAAMDAEQAKRFSRYITEFPPLALLEDQDEYRVIRVALELSAQPQGASSISVDLQRADEPVRHLRFSRPEEIRLDDRVTRIRGVRIEDISCRGFEYLRVLFVCEEYERGLRFLAADVVEVHGSVSVP